MKNFVEVKFLGRFYLKEYAEDARWFTLEENTGETVDQPYGKMTLEDMKAVRDLFDREIEKMEGFPKKTDFKDLVEEVLDYEPEMTEDGAYSMFRKLHQEAYESYLKHEEETGEKLPPKYCSKCKQLMFANSGAYEEGFHYDTCI